MDVEGRYKEKQEIVKRYFEAERKLMLAEKEIIHLNEKVAALEKELLDLKR